MTGRCDRVPVICIIVAASLLAPVAFADHSRVHDRRSFPVAIRAKRLDDVPFAHVYAYELTAEEESGVIDESGHLARSARVPGKELSSAQAEQLRTLLLAPDGYSGWPRYCFEPHLGFIFLDDRGSLIADVSVCFRCNALVAHPRSRAHVRRALTYAGLGRAQRRGLQQLCRDLRLGHCG